MVIDISSLDPSLSYNVESAYLKPIHIQEPCFWKFFSRNMLTVANLSCNGVNPESRGKLFEVMISFKKVAQTKIDGLLPCLTQPKDHMKYQLNFTFPTKYYSNPQLFFKVRHWLTQMSGFYTIQQKNNGISGFQSVWKRAGFTFKALCWVPWVPQAKISSSTQSTNQSAKEFLGSKKL